jgi:mannose-6-phosphate isomerase-like protein (cupin superfamily)
MRRIVGSSLIALSAFTLGFAVSRIPVARAASAPLTAQVVDLSTLQSDDLNPAAPGATFRSKTLAVADGATVALQIGTVKKHYHADANEIQYVVEGMGTEYLGDKIVDLRPGVLLIVPKGAPHAGSIETSGHLKLLVVKTPPQAADDTHFLP